MIYAILKMIHIISASMLVGSMIAAPIYQSVCRQDAAATSLIGKLLISGCLLTLIIQPASGFAIIAIQHYNPMALWVMVTLLGFLLLSCLCLAMIYLQQQSTMATLRWLWGLLIISLPILTGLYYSMVEHDF